MNSSDDAAPATPSPRDGLSAQLEQLEAFVARSETGGEQIPAEALEMIARLREIVSALDGLTASLGDTTTKGHTTEPS